MTAKSVRADTNWEKAENRVKYFFQKSFSSVRFVRPSPKTACLGEIPNSRLVYYCAMRVGYTGQLSKWWKTPSAQAAMARAKAKKRASLNKFLTSLKEKREKIAREAMEWEVVE